MESTNNNIAKTSFFSSIRTWVIFGVGAILVLSIIIIAISYLTIETVEGSMESMLSQEGVVRDLGVEVEQSYLIARQSEADFLNSWEVIGVESAQVQYVATNTAELATARTELERLIMLAETSTISSKDSIVTEARSLLPLLDRYETAFLTTVAQIDERSRTGGLENELEVALEQLQRDVQSLDGNSFNDILVDLQLNLQKYARTTQQQYIDNNRISLNTFNDRLAEETNQTQVATIQTTLQAYQEQFNALVTLDQNIANNTTIFREVTEDIEGSVTTISLAGQNEFDAAHDVLFGVLRQTILVLRVLTIITPILGIFVTILLIRRIMTPLTKLTRAAEVLGGGNFNHAVAIKNHDEFLLLGTTFNRMADQLNQFIGSLEERVEERTKALETSVQVSRQLSTILAEDQLVTSVVHEVQRAFDYYHVQIYDFDQETGNLHIVGGTGNAGNTLVSNGHFIPQGKGIVGKAAQARHPILVPDVSADPTWLPNPLLPDTKAEIAVPILAGGQTLGVLDVQSDTPHGLDEEDINLLVAIAGQVGIGLNNARSYASLQQRAQVEERISTIGQKIQASPTVESVLQVAARELGQALNATYTAVQLTNPLRTPSNDSQI